MGFCGCSFRASAITAAVFGVVQSIIGIILASVLTIQFVPGIASRSYRTEVSSSGNVRRYFDNYPYNDPKMDIALGMGYATCKAICEAYIAFNVFWLVSTIVLIVGISKKHVGLHQQWTAVTSCVLITDTVLFIVACTQFPYIDSPQRFPLILLLSLLSRFGIIGFICDICLAIYVYQRASEILRGPIRTTQVIVDGGSSIQVIHAGQIVAQSPAQPTVLPAQFYFPPGQQEVPRVVNPPYYYPASTTVTGIPGPP